MPTITEGLAEIKTISKRIAKKQEFILQYLFRQEQVKDPLAKDGGSYGAIAREMQSVTDLLQRQVELRKAIHAANAETSLTIKGREMTLADWIVWKREAAPALQTFYGALRSRIAAARADLQKKGLTVAETATNPKPNDVIIELDERGLAQKIEDLEEVLGTLDGLLSLKNATVVI